MSVTRTRLGAAALAVAGLLFLLYPAVRPWHDESTAVGAIASLSSPAWVASHLFAMVGFVLVPLGLLALRAAVRDHRSEPLALGSVVTFWIGAGLTLPYYGAETFALHAIAVEADGGGPLDVVGLAETIRLDVPAAVATFGLGLLLLGAGAVLAAVAVWRSELLHRAIAVPFAAGFVLFLPQFFMPAPARIAHGVLVAAGCVLLAAALWRTPPAPAGQARSMVTLGGNSRSANRPMA